MSNTSLLNSPPRPKLTQSERQAFARRRVVLPVAGFLVIAALYLGVVFLALALPVPLGLVVSPLAGVLIGLLFIVGHDACHDSLTPLTWMNQTIGRLAFLPALHSFSLWDLAHNRLHHCYNNIRGMDVVWEPLSPSDYQAAGAIRRWMYRFYHTPGGVGFYYLIELWAPYFCCSMPAIYKNMRLVYVADAVLVISFFAAQVGAVVAVGGLFGHGTLVSLAIGIVVPFLVWNGLISIIVFVHHTHPAVRWYPTVAAWQADQGATSGTAHVWFVWPIGPMVLSIMEHNAHHVAPGVPLYNLPRMQRALEVDQRFLTWQFSWTGLVRICERCKLYDYAADRWVTFKDAENEPAGQ
jgi:omega-6 fatty acid desaturase (delta-12 desaturase)